MVTFPRHGCQKAGCAPLALAMQVPMARGVHAAGRHIGIDAQIPVGIKIGGGGSRHGEVSAREKTVGKRPKAKRPLARLARPHPTFWQANPAEIKDESAGSGIGEI
jgi:hypothetical protein